MCDPRDQRRVERDGSRCAGKVIVEGKERTQRKERRQIQIRIHSQSNKRKSSERPGRGRLHAYTAKEKSNHKRGAAKI